MSKLLIATGNAGKVREIKHELELNGLTTSLQVLGLKDLPFYDECVEDQLTFESNAAKKALHYASLAGCLTLADDSGLCVDALHGAPGVYSARYAGITGPGADAANNAKLMGEMEKIPDDQRQVKFVCAMSLATPPPHEKILLTLTDEVHGLLLREPRGKNGFGYDPYFFFPQFNKTTAELDLTTKSQISHRGKALRKIIAWLRENASTILMPS